LRISHIIQARKEFQAGVAEAEAQGIIRAVMSSKKYETPSIRGTIQESKEKYSVRNLRRIARYTALNMERKAQLIDGNRKGESYNLLITRERTQDDIKQRNIDRRLDKIEKVMIKNGITKEELYNDRYTLFTLPVIRNGKVVNEEQQLTLSGLADVYASSFRPEKKAAVSYGNFVDIQEKVGMTDEEIIETGDTRYNAALDVAKAHLQQKHMELIDAIFEDARNEFQRANEVYIREFNIASPQVENYSSMYRLDDSGDDIAKSLIQDVTGKKSSGTSKTVETGFLQETVRISPRNQTPIKLGLFEGHESHVKTFEHFVAFATLGKEVNRVFNGKSESARMLRSSIISTYGKPMMDDVTRDDKPKQRASAQEP